MLVQAMVMISDNMFQLYLMQKKENWACKCHGEYIGPVMIVKIGESHVADRSYLIHHHQGIYQCKNQEYQLFVHVEHGLVEDVYVSDKLVT